MIVANLVDHPTPGLFMMNTSNKSELLNAFPDANIKFVRPTSMATKSNKLAVYHISGFYVPSNFNEAIAGMDCVQWKDAMDEEYAQHLANKTWTLVPRNTTPICKLFYPARSLKHSISIDMGKKLLVKKSLDFSQSVY